LRGSIGSEKRGREFQYASIMEQVGSQEKEADTWGVIGPAFDYIMKLGGGKKRGRE